MKEWKDSQYTDGIIDKKVLEIYHNIPASGDGSQELYDRMIAEIRKSDNMSLKQICETLRILFISTLKMSITSLDEKQNEEDREKLK